MVGFTFRGIHSSTFKILCREINRTLLPPKKTVNYEVPGRNGILSYDYDDQYLNRPISVELGLFENITAEELRSNIREIAYWLSGTGTLVFDDEPDKGYTARVTELVPFTPAGANDFITGAFSAGTSTVNFDCQPFAETPNYKTVVNDITESGQVTQPIDIIGTVDTPCIMIIKNTGLTDIHNIRIVVQRKVER